MAGGAAADMVAGTAVADEAAGAAAADGLAGAAAADFSPAAVQQYTVYWHLFMHLFEDMTNPII